MERIYKDGICPSCLEHAQDFMHDEDLETTICMTCLFEIYLADYVPHVERKHPDEFLAKVERIRSSPSYENKFSFITWIEVD